MSNIRDGLIESNPWWKGDFDLEYKDREAYDEIQKFIALPQIVALTGLRRVGKTTLMFKMAKDAITKGLDPKAVVYFSFDEFHESPIREVLRGYETIMREDLGAGRHLILLDEVQKLRGWEDQLKAVYDRYRKKLKIIISGSESLFIRKGSRESLAGRIFEFKIDPLSFREYLFFLGIKYEPLELYERELARL